MNQVPLIAVLGFTLIIVLAEKVENQDQIYKIYLMQNKKEIRSLASLNRELIPSGIQDCGFSILH